MPTIKLGTSSETFNKVVLALEGVAGVPHSTGGDAAWIKQLVGVINEANGTDITYTGHNWGDHFSYTTPKSAVLLGKIKEKYAV